MGNVLYYGDNLDLLKRYVKDESVDLIYLDPPFKKAPKAPAPKDGSEQLSFLDDAE